MSQTQRDDTLATATLARDPYGSATRVDAQERGRMDEQFVLHSQPTLDRAIQAVGGHAGLRLLDAGSGHGAVALAFTAAQHQPADILLLDTNPELLMLAHRRLREAGLPAHGHLGAIDVDPLPPSMGGQDVVLLSFTATHLQDLEAGLSNAARAARVGGVVVVADVDYPASFAVGCPAAAEALAAVKRKLHIDDLSARLPRAAAAAGLVPHPEIGCHDRWQVYRGIQGVRDLGLGFIGSFHADDDAVPPWRRIGPAAQLYMRRMAHVYLRNAQI